MIEEVQRLELQQKITNGGAQLSVEDYKQKLGDITNKLLCTHLDQIPNHNEYFNGLAEREEEYLVRIFIVLLVLTLESFNSILF